MNLLKAAALVAGLLPIIVLAAPAHADVETFDWSMNGPAAALGGFPLPESGELTATMTGAGVWKVDTLTIEGSTIDRLSTFDSADDLIYTNGFAALDGSGLSFEAPTGQNVNVFSFFGQGTPPTGNAYGEIASPGGFGVGAFTISAAPEPSTWVLMFAGIGAIGLMLGQSKPKISVLVKNLT